jgi:hypothetical protein
MNYGEALEALKRREKISCKRWGNEGKVYIRLEYIDHVDNESLKLTTLVLVDTIRDKAVIFTPSVENQLEDEWYIVD